MREGAGSPPAADGGVHRAERPAQRASRGGHAAFGGFDPKRYETEAFGVT
jgi:hypothetical protein